MEPINDEDEPGFFRRNRVALVAGVAVVIVLGASAYFWTGKEAKVVRRAPEISMVKLVALPPPPPPPPPAPPKERPPEPVVKQPEFQPEEKPAEEKPPEAPKTDEPPAAPLGTNIQGEGNDGFGLAKGGGNGGGNTLGGNGKGGGGGTRWGWYAGQVQSRVSEAIRGHRLTRSASLSLKVRVWADASGRITRVALANSSGSPATDQAIQNEILGGLQLKEPPPEGMPMPIVMRISAQRPN